MRSRSAIEGADMVASTFVVGLDLIECDFTSLSEAMANLPATYGGKIYMLGGSFSEPQTITYPDAEVVISGSGPGSTVLVPTFNGPLFTVPNGLTAFRRYVIEDLSSIGTNAGSDAFLQLEDSESRGKPEIAYVQLTGWRAALKITAGDLDYTEPVEVRFSHCAVFSPNANSPLVISPGSAGSYAFGMVVWFDQCMLSNEQGVSPILDLGWQVDFDGDFILSGTPHLTLSGNSAIDGFMCSDGVEVELQGGVTFEIHGQSYWGVTTGKIFGGGNGGTYKISAPYSYYYFKPINATIVVNADQVQIDVNTFFTPAAVQVDILAGADYCVVTGTFLDSTTAAIRTAATYGTFRGTFASTGVHNTVLETGAADFNNISDCPGVNTGGGVTLVGTSSIASGALLSQYSAVTTNAFVSMMSIANPKGLQGIGTVENKGANSIDVKELFTDASGTSVTATTTVPAGDRMLLRLDITSGLCQPPYVTYEVQVKDTVNGSHGLPELYFTSQGALK
jgi:hypothetical protein